MKKIIIKIGAAVLLLIACLVLSNSVYKKYFYANELIESDAELKVELDSLQYVSDVMYFGESSNFNYSFDDTCKQSISKMIDSLVPAKVNDIDHGALHAKTYLSLIKTIQANTSIKTIIVTLNLRSFGAPWIHSKVETALMKSNVMYDNLPPIIQRAKLALNVFDNKSEKERNETLEKHWQNDYLHVPNTFAYKNVRAWDDAYGGKNKANYLLPNGSWDMPRIELACHYIKNYAFTINPNTNPRIKDFDEIVEVAKQKNIKLVYNLMAENFEYTDSLVGKTLSNLMKENAALLINRYTKKGVVVVNNLQLVPGIEFSEKRWTSEHYTQRGRLAIAKNVVNTCNSFKEK